MMGIAAAGLGVGVFAAGVLLAQRWDRERGGRRGGYSQRELSDLDRNGVPMWEVEANFKSDVFTFVRVRYSDGGGGWGRGGGWRTDYPDSDLNFSFRLQQLTSLKVDPRPRIVSLTDEELFDYPFIYMIEPGDLWLDEAEVVALRRYLLNGGFLMVDDFWGEEEWDVFYRQIKKVFPDAKQEPVELPLEHEIFHCVYDLKEKPQIPAINWARRYRGTARYTSETWDAAPASFKAIFDDKGRMIVIICHNTDLGDGWEREGEEEWYFKEFAEPKSYPMGINIVFYAMTH